MCRDPNTSPKHRCYGMASGRNVLGLVPLLSRMLKNSSTGAHHVQVCTADLSPPGRFRKATPRRGRAMNKVVVFRPACRAVVQGSAGLPPGQRRKRMLRMRLASPTSPAHVAVSSDIMKRSFSTTC
jgi:hypothetical protein